VVENCHPGALYDEDSAVAAQQSLCVSQITYKPSNRLWFCLSND
jgi:hypothetical protein